MELAKAVVDKGNHQIVDLNLQEREEFLEKQKEDAAKVRLRKERSYAKSAVSAAKKGERSLSTFYGFLLSKKKVTLFILFLKGKEWKTL